jgi:segregation and condensation protein B
MRTLTLRGLVDEAGADPETGAILFRTTGYFLERLGLPGLEDLPDLAPFLPDYLDDEQDTDHEHAGS